MIYLSWHWIERMQNLLRVKIGLVGSLLRRERPEVEVFPVDTDSCHPPPIFGVVVSPKLSIFGVPVLLVKQIGGFSKVANTVVRLYSIDVVNVFFGPTAIRVQPSKSVNLVLVHVDTHLEIPVMVKPVEGCASFAASPPKADYSGENTGIWVVMKKLAQACCGKIGLSHDAPYQRIGQRPGRVCSTSRLRHFSVSNACLGAH